jgi:hypothetical protein
MGKSAKTPQAPTLGQNINDVVAALPMLYGAEQQFGPAWQSLNLGNLEGALFGTESSTVPNTLTAGQAGYYDAQGNYLGTSVNGVGRNGGNKLSALGQQGGGLPEGVRWFNKGQTFTQGTRDVAGTPGLLSLYQRLLPELTAAQTGANTAVRTANLADVNALAPEARAAWRGANEQQAGLLDALNERAQQQLALGSQMDPDTAAMIRNNVMAGASNRGWGYNPGDLGRVAMTTGQAGEQLRGQRQNFAGSVAGYNQAASIDPFAAIVNAGADAGGAMNFMGMTGAGANQNPLLGLMGMAHDNQMTGYNAAVSTNAANAQMGNSLLGSGLGAIGTVGAALLCWVAREVFGAEDARWLMFRHWLLTSAPGWFRRLYLRHGEAFAAWLHDHPWAKPPIRAWMRWIIRDQTDGVTHFQLGKV